MQGGLQSPTWSDSKNSRAIFLACTTLSDTVLMSMPSAASVAQALASLPNPLISTTQSPQPPYGFTFSWWHSVGISTPFDFAISRMVWPFSPIYSLPFIFTFNMFSLILQLLAYNCLETANFHAFPAFCACFAVNYMHFFKVA